MALQRVLCWISNILFLVFSSRINQVCGTLKSDLISLPRICKLLILKLGPPPPPPPPHGGSEWFRVLQSLKKFSMRSSELATKKREWARRPRHSNHEINRKLEMGGGGGELSHSKILKVQSFLGCNFQPNAIEKLRQKCFMIQN